ncbi:MAG: hypothetical protein AMJ81_07770 [Phycisphaerae bacterium SM23_33]|jgi:Tfp pilus assembly protein PilN|nr:MAG: hypothetical protein AMJ81_07770 [Phycisphaerae bacterium SM23_33]
MSLINLLPEDYVARRARRRANLLCAVLFGAVIGGVLVAAVLSEKGYRRTQEVSERVNQAYTDAGKLIQQLQELEATKQRLMDKAKVTAGLLERVPRSYLLAVVTQALPEGTSLTHFKLQGKRVISVSAGEAKSRYEAAVNQRQKELQKVSKLDIEITVTGLAATDVEVARFIAAMARCPLMETVDLVYSQQKNLKECVVREFQVILRLKLEADVLDTEPPSGPLLTLAGEDTQAGSRGEAQ